MNAPTWWLAFKMKADQGIKSEGKDKTKKPEGTGPYKYGAVVIRRWRLGEKHMALVAAGEGLTIYEALLYKQGLLKVVPLTAGMEGMSLTEIKARLS